MTNRDHLSSPELATARANVRDLDPAAVRHLDGCVVCKIRLARLKQGDDFSTQPPAQVASLTSDAPLVAPQLLQAMQSDPDSRTRPEAGELWRAGRDEAVLVWIRDIVSAHSVEVVPLVLESSIADDMTVAINAEATVLGVEALAVVSMRTQIHVDAFINRLDVLDLRTDVDEVILAARERRAPVGVTLAERNLWPSAAADDERFELHESLRRLTPAAWEDEQSTRNDSDELPDGILEDIDTQRIGQPRGLTAILPPPEREPATPAVPTSGWDDNFQSIADQLEARLWGIRCHRAQQTSHRAGDVSVESFFKAFYLDTTVLAVIATTTGGPHRVFDLPLLLEALDPLTRLESDADAVVVCVPGGEWESVLLTRAHMRTAVQLPAGETATAMFTISGFGLIDTLTKHLDGAVLAWELLDGPESRLHGTNVHDAAHRHAVDSASRVRTEGSRARTPEKVLGWGLAAETESAVARFVAAAASDTSIDSALSELDLDETDD